MLMALNAQPQIGLYRMLALVGPPGSAKSTMVRLLANDMGVALSGWQVRGLRWCRPRDFFCVLVSVARPCCFAVVVDALSSAANKNSPK